MKFMLISPKNRTVYNFRGDLIREIIAAGYTVVVTGPDQTNVDRVTELGARFVEIPMRKNGLNPAEDLRYQRALYALCRQERPDVVLGYTSKPVIYGTIAAKKAGVPHAAAMVTGAGYAFTANTRKAKIIRRIMRILYKKAFSLADTVIFQNPDDMAQFVRERMVSEGKCQLVSGSGVDPERFPVWTYPSQITFFMLARVMYSKGIREYLEACTIIRRKYPHVRCMLLGACENIQDSIPAQTLQKYVDDGIIEYFGETDQVAEYYKQCSVYVLPSYREGTPRTVLEAMSMGRPVITTDAPGCRETVRDGETGFLVPVGSGQAVADRMERFIQKPDLIPVMGAAGAAYCRERFAVSKVNQDMCRYLKIRKEAEGKGSGVI